MSPSGGLVLCGARDCPTGWTEGHVEVEARLCASRETKTAPEYARRLLAAFAQPEVKDRANRDLLEPLSERELDVLRLLGTELDGPDIARQLVVSLSTVRTHARSIYSKLGVNNRRAAVRRADELHLLSTLF